MSNTSLQLTGMATNVITQINSSGSFAFGWRNWSIPEGCIMILLSQMELLPWNNPDGMVSADTRRVVQQVKNCTLLLQFLLGVPANVINMAVFYKQGLKDRVTLCLFFLAFSDALYLTSAMMFQAEELYMQFLSDQGVGPYFTFIVNNKLLVILGTYYTSPIFSAIIAIERCLCVFNPLKFQSLIRTRTMAVTIFVVYVSVYALSFVLFIRFRIGCLYDPLYGVEIMAAVEGEFYQANKDLINVIEGVVLGVGVLGGTMVVVMIATVLTIVKLGQIRQWRSETTSSFSSRDIALTRMLVSSSILFVVCVSPYASFNFVRLFFPEVDYGQRQHNLFLCCALIGEAFVLIKPCSNIFVYYIMGSRYRQTFWAVFGTNVLKGIR